MAQHAADSYYIPHGTKWPIVGSLGMVTMLASAAGWMNGQPPHSGRSGWEWPSLFS